MSRKPNTEFRLRAYYPNYYSLQQVLSHPFDDGVAENLPGFLMPELEFKKPGEQTFQSFPLRNIDVSFLCQSDREQALLYLDILISSLNNNATARKKRESLSNQYLKSLQLRFGSLNFIENDSVVPAATINPYDELLLSQKGKVLLDLY
jgi:hypothetical protein